MSLCGDVVKAAQRKCSLSRDLKRQVEVDYQTRGDNGSLSRRNSMHEGPEVGPELNRFLEQEEKVKVAGTEETGEQGGEGQRDGRGPGHGRPKRDRAEEFGLLTPGFSVREH